MQIIESLPGSGRELSLTFDDGPNRADTPRLLEILRRHAVTAVFCLVGREVDARPDLVRAIVADGHALGNHSRYHDDLSTWPADRIAEDLQATNAAIDRAVPGVEVPWFRAPYGHWGASPAVATALGLRPLGWRLSVADWECPGTPVLVQRLSTGITPGAVVLLHDGGGDVASGRDDRRHAQVAVAKCRVRQPGAERGGRNARQVRHLGAGPQRGVQVRVGLGAGRAGQAHRQPAR